MPRHGFRNERQHFLQMLLILRIQHGIADLRQIDQYIFPLRIENFSQSSGQCLHHMNKNTFLRGKFFYDFLFFLIFCIEIRAAFSRPDLGLFEPPGIDLFMIARQKYLRYLLSVPVLRSGILGIFQQIVMKALCLGGFVVIEHSGYQSRHSVHHDHGSQFSAGENIISDGDIIGYHFLQYSLINSFVMSAEQYKFLLPGQFLRLFLGKGCSLRSQIDTTHVPVSSHRPVCVIHRLCLHQHSGAAAISIIIYFSMLVLCVIPDIHRIDGDQVLLRRSS